MGKDKRPQDGHYWGSRGTRDPDPEAQPLPGGFDAESGAPAGGTPPQGERPKPGNLKSGPKAG